MPSKPNVVIISLDKSLVGAPELGDAIERHRQYGRSVGFLDIIVYSPAKDHLHKLRLSENTLAWPTGSRHKFLFFFDVLKIFKKIYRQHRIDIVVCQDPFLTALIGCYLKRKYQLKLQINFHGDFWQNKLWLKERKLNYLFWLISKFTVPCADIIRVMSHGQQQKLIHAGIQADKIRVIATPVRLSQYLKHQVSPKNNSQQKIILHVGRDDQVKDYPTLIKAFEHVFKEYNFVALHQVGADKHLKQHLTKLPAKLKSKIILHGFQPHERLLALYYSADVVVLSSKSESFGKVLVEANACAKPVVSTVTTGAQEIIQDGYNGFLVPIGDAEKLAEKILYLLNHPDLAKQMGQQGRELVKQKFVDNTQKIISLWQDLMDNK